MIQEDGVYSYDMLLYPEMILCYRDKLKCDITPPLPHHSNRQASAVRQASGTTAPSFLCLPSRRPCRDHHFFLFRLHQRPVDATTAGMDHADRYIHATTPPLIVTPEYLHHHCARCVRPCAASASNDDARTATAVVSSTVSQRHLHPSPPTSAPVPLSTKPRRQPVPRRGRPEKHAEK
jgi:hypothetical protein